MLIPEEYGGSGLGLRAATAVLEEIHRSGCNGGACHAQMYTMGTILRHGSDAQKKRLSAEDRRGRAAAAGLRRDRAHQRHRHHAHPHFRRTRRRQVRRQRPEDLDQPRRALRSDGAAGAHHAARRGREAHGRHERAAGRYARGGRQGPHHPADPHHDEPRHDRAVLRRSGSAGGESDRRGGQGLPLHPRRHERRAHPDRVGMHRRRALLHRSRQSPTPRSARCSAGRSARTRACSSRSPAPTCRSRPPR